MRHDKGMGIINQIMSILKEISFGVFHFEIGMLLRTTMLINGILYNTEALFNIQQSHIDKLEECDKSLMRKLFNTEQGTPIESYYLETSAWPLRFIIMARQFMFYWTMLQKSERELAKQVFIAQGQFPSKKKDDWVSQVQGDLNSCGINYQDDELRRMSEYRFKKLIKEQIQLKVMGHLFALQNKHSKSEKLVFKGSMQPYLISSDLSTQNKQILFKLRSKMLKIKSNYSSMYRNNMQCSLCEQVGTIENEEHLLVCSRLTDHPSLKDDIGTVQYSDVFSSNGQKQQLATKVFKQIMYIYDRNRK